MPSTYTPSLKLELIANGDQVNTWGNTTNNNLGTLIEQAITGVQPITLTGDTTLTSYNGLSDQARNAVLVFNGSLSNAANVTIPSEPKTYIVSNQSGANVTIKTSTGTGFTLANGVNSFIYCDATNVAAAIDTSHITGDLTVSGNQTVGGSITIGGDITIGNTIASNSGTLSLSSSTGVIDMAVNSGAFTPPYGATSDRPASPELGMTRWNSTGGYLEIWNGVQWQNITGNYAVNFLVVAGGGGGGAQSFQGSGGGGAGGLLSNSTTVTVGTSYTITVGSGGAANGNGTSSSAFSNVAVGGGSGAGSNLTSINGGSGGGKCTRDNPDENFGPGSGTAGQGYAGSSGISGYIGAGGGGASQAGQGINGGNGLASSITGSSTYYAGGGGGGNRQVGNGGSGGLGGGGSAAASGNSGTANTGGGGAGGGSDPGAYGAGSGGSGVVIIAYASASQRGTGGSVTSYTSAGTTYFVHTFTTSGTYIA